MGDERLSAVARTSISWRGLTLRKLTLGDIGQLEQWLVDAPLRKSAAVQGAAIQDALAVAERMQTAVLTIANARPDVDAKTRREAESLAIGSLNRALTELRRVLSERQGAWELRSKRDLATCWSELDQIENVIYVLWLAARKDDPGLTPEKIAADLPPTADVIADCVRVAREVMAAGEGVFADPTVDPSIGGNTTAK